MTFRSCDIFAMTVELIRGVSSISATVHLLRSLNKFDMEVRLQEHTDVLNRNKALIDKFAQFCNMQEVEGAVIRAELAKWLKEQVALLEAE